MNSLWTKIQTDMFANPELSDKDIAQLCGKSEPAVRGKRQRINAGGGNFTPAPKVKPAPTYEEDREEAATALHKRRSKALEEKYKKALEERAATDIIVDAVRETAPVSYSPAPVIYRKKSTGKGKPQTLVLLLSDTHCGAIVKPEQTGGSGLYNFPVFLARLHYYQCAIESIVRDHTTTPVEEIVLLLGGDMLDGALNHGAECGQENTIFTQFHAAGHAISQWIRAISALAPGVRVYCTAGNHTRFQNQKRMPTNQRFSNFDTFLYSLIEALTKDLTTVKWHLDEQPVADFFIYGFGFRLFHGDQLKGFDRALGIPSHSIGRMISATTSICEKEGRVAPSWLICGHMHREMSLPTAKGAVLVGGAFVGLDGYALSSSFTPVDPSQLLFYVHPKFGKTATYSISLKHAEVSDVPPYDIPGGFPCR